METCHSARLVAPRSASSILCIAGQDMSVGPASKDVAVQKRMGENINSEWERDPYADKVWDALQLIKSDPEQGLAALLNLGAKNSSLALMFAGNSYAKGNNTPKDENIAIDLLNKSLDLGSIEGGYILAHLHMVHNRFREGFDTYNRLVDLGYSPAMYSLGYYCVFGDPSIRNFEYGAKLFERAASLGHFHAKFQFANILIGKKTLYGFVRGLFIKLTSMVPYFYFRSKYPNSDRLRT